MTADAWVDDVDLPDAGPVERFDIASAVLPARGAHAAGDFYVVERREDGSAMVVLADVCGHGDEAAAVAAAVRPTLERRARHASSPSDLLEQVNRDLGPRAAVRGFLSTAVAAMFDSRRRQLWWASAGHPPPHWLASGQPLNGGVPGPPIGVRGVVGCTSSSAHAVTAGDGLLLYSDGLPDAKGIDGTRFGIAAVSTSLAAVDASSAQAAVDEITRTVSAFTGGEFVDDVCVLAVRIP